MDVASRPKEVQDYIHELNTSWEHRYGALEEQYKLLLLQKFGRKSEKESREEILVDISEEEKQCACGHELVRIGEETSERLQVIPFKM